MLTYGFYNSVNHDRTYDALQMSSMLDGIISDGVFENVGNKFYVSENPDAALSVLVDPGRAWFNHTWTVNDSRMVLTIPESHQTLARIDAVVLEVNADIAVRENSIKIISGEPSSDPQRPTLINTETVHQYALAYIRVSPRATTIAQADITNMAGSTDTPYVMMYVEVTGGYSYVRYLTSADDMDNLKNIGIYYYETGNVPRNAPYNNSAIVEVPGISDATAYVVTQRVTRTDVAGKTSFRSLSSSGAWTTWAEIVVQGDLSAAAVGSAKKLSPGAKIDGVLFDGSTDITTPSYKFIRVLTGSDDLDSLTTTLGTYYYNTSNVPRNTPYSNSSIVEVIRCGADSLIQRVTRMDVEGKMAWRGRTSSGWTNWVESLTTGIDVDLLMKFRRVLTSSDDLNSINLDLGIYIYASGSLPVNRPSGYDSYSIVEIAGSGDGTILQRVTRANTAGKSSWRVYTTSGGSGWSRWRETLTDADLDSILHIQRQLTSGTNLNNLTDVGIYYYATDASQNTSQLGYPTPNSSILEVIKYGDNSVLQRVTRNGVAGVSYFRANTSQGWGDWTRILTEPDLTGVMRNMNVLTGSNDLNSVEEAGIYWWLAGAQPNHAPSTAACILEVFSVGTSFRVQRATRVGQNAQSFWRGHTTGGSDSGGWSDWREILTDADKTALQTSISNLEKSLTTSITTLSTNAVQSRRQLTSSDNLNNLRDVGVYYNPSGTAHTGAPGGLTTSYILEVVKYSDNTVIQRATRNGVPGVSYFRANTSGTSWNDWKLILTEDDKTALTKTINDLSIQKGAELTLNNTILNGYITNAGKTINLTLNLGRQIAASSASVTVFNATLRGVKGYLDKTSSDGGGSSINLTGTTTVSATIRSQSNTITISSVRTAAWSNYENNTPVSVLPANLTIRFS